MTLGAEDTPAITVVYQDYETTEGEKSLLGPVRRMVTRVGTLDAADLAANLSAFCRQMGAVFEQVTTAVDRYELATFEVALEVTAKGEIRFVGRQVERTIRTVLSHWNGNPDALDLVLLAGQGSKIFTVREILDGLDLPTRVMDSLQETAVAHGLASYASELSGQSRSVLLLNVLHRGLGIRCLPGGTPETRTISRDAARNTDTVTIAHMQSGMMFSFAVVRSRVDRVGSCGPGPSLLHRHLPEGCLGLRSPGDLDQLQTGTVGRSCRVPGRKPAVGHPGAVGTAPECRTRPGAEGVQGQGGGRGQQHQVLHHVLALDAQQQRVAVHEGHVGPQHQHQEGARQLQRGPGQDDRHPAAEQEPGPEGDLERAHQRHRQVGVDHGRDGGDQRRRQGRLAGELERPEPEEGDAQRAPEQQRNGPAKQPVEQPAGMPPRHRRGADGGPRQHQPVTSIVPVMFGCRLHT
jgi:hypothetical protein